MGAITDLWKELHYLKLGLCDWEWFFWLILGQTAPSLDGSLGHMPSLHGLPLNQWQWASLKKKTVTGAFSRILFLKKWFIFWGGIGQQEPSANFKPFTPNSCSATKSPFIHAVNWRLTLGPAWWFYSMLRTLVTGIQAITRCAVRVSL